MKLHANAALSLNGRRQLACRVVDQGWTLVEAAGAAEGLIPPASADAIAAAADVERFDLAAIVEATGESATPVIAIVAGLRAAVGPEVAPHVHLGATSQDIVDTVAMLIAARALVPLLADLDAAAADAAALARTHRDTRMAARTLLQHAELTTFGLRAAGWLVGLHEATARLREVRSRRLAVQMGGPVGTRPPQVASRVAAALGLVEPVLPWGAVRVRVAELAAALGAAAGICAKIARDVMLLAQNEVGELREGGGPGRGSSSAMAHKRNPVASVTVAACATRVPGLVATIFATMDQEHERAAGGRQAEWGTLSDLLVLSGAAAAWTANLLRSLEVHAAAMARTPPHGEAIAAAVAGARPVVLPRGAHMAAIEHPGEVAAMIVAHVDAQR